MAIKANLVVDQGTDFSTSIFLKDDQGDPLPVADYTAAAEMRKTYTSSTSVDFTTELIEGTGELLLKLSHVQTANLTPGRYVYDVELTDTSANVVSRIVEGIVTVTPEVTR